MSFQDFLIISPEIVISFTAILVFLLDLFINDKKILVPVSISGLVISFILTLGLWNGWLIESPGIYAFFSSIKLDEFSLFFKVLIILSAVAVIGSSGQYINSNIESKGEFLGLLLLSITGMLLLVSSVELITVWVSLELTAIPLVALVALGKNDTSLEASLKFLILSAVSSVVILYGLVFLYGYSGSTYFNDMLSYISSSNSSPGDLMILHYGLLIGIILLVLGISFKFAAFPFQMWVPDVYQGAPTPITAYLSVVSKAAGFAVLLRIIYSVLGGNDFSVILSNLFAIIAVFSMTIGNVMALRQNDIKRLLAYSTIAHAGYLLIGVASLNISGIGENLYSGPQGVLYYLAGYAFTNLTAFLLIIGVSKSIGTFELSGFAGLRKKSPLTSFVLAVSVISLLGIPPTVGFMSKIFILSAAVNTNLTWLAIVGVINSVISAYYYLRILKIAFVDPEENQSEIKISKAISLITLVGVIGILLLGIFPSLILEIAEIAVMSIVNI